jgi:inorganic pyrophosphatase
VRIKAWGAVVMTDRGMSDDKLICSHQRLLPGEQREVLGFFRFYARCKGVLNFLRRRPGRNACEGWIEPQEAISRARLRDASWRGPTVPY